MLQDPPIPTGPAGLRALRAMARGRNILAALEVFHRELGDVFRITLPGFSPVFLVGPEANHFMLVTARDRLLWRPDDDPVTRLLRHGVLVEDGEKHDELRKRIDPAL